MEIFCDSSYNEQTKTAGLGWFIKNGVKQECISNKIQCDNNNLGEMWSLYIASILSGGKLCTIYTDSQVALDFIHNSVKSKTRKDFNTQQQWINYNQMKVLSYKARMVSPNITFAKVKAHRKENKQEFVANNIADLMSKLGNSR